VPTGLFYVYHRDMDMEAHHDWQLTAVDFRTGWRVFSIKGWFDDNVSGIVKKRPPGKKDDGRKVFKNIWGTFSFGPKNSIFIGTYRGYVVLCIAKQWIQPIRPFEVEPDVVLVRDADAAV